MIEVLFADSEVASMKAAKNVIAGTKWIQGAPEEVICLSYMLDIGDINKEICSQYRKDLIYSLYNQGQWDNGNQTDEIFDQEFQNAVDLYMQEIHRLTAYLNAGNFIRVWYSDAPYSRCGLYYLCHFLYYVLKKYTDKIYVVKLPEYIVREKNIILYQTWGEVAAEEFARFLPCEKILTKQEVHMCALLWNELVTDNSPLRAMVNGKIIGVPEDFYDFIIFKKLTHKPVKVCRLIGDILGSYPIGIWDWWYAKRILYYIKIGKIKVLSDSEKLYARLICLA